MLRFIAISFLSIVSADLRNDKRYSSSSNFDLDYIKLKVPDAFVNETTIQDIFGLYTYPASAYKKYIGLDYTSIFSNAIAINEKFVVVGSHGYNIFEGIVHIYTPVSLCEWTLQSYIRSPIADNNNFGVSVAIDGLAVAIGANSWAAYIGKVFIYRFTENKYWLHEATLMSPMGVGEGFGHTVALSGDFALVTTGTNHAFIYELVNNQWTLNSQLMPPGVNIHFGYTASIDGDTIVVGAESVGGSEGAVFVYKLNQTNPAHNWYLTDTLTSVDGYSSYFGHAVDISENTIVVGAKGFEPVVFQARANQTANNTGWAYIYDFNQTSSKWSLSQRLVSPVGDKSNFGASVAVHKGALIVGADGFPAGARTGASFIYKRNETNTDMANWKLDSALPSAAGYAARFGAAVDISDTYTATGAYAYDDLRGGIFLACRLDANQPSPSPVFVPSLAGQPTSSPTTNAEKFSGGEFNTVKSKWSWGMLLAILLAAIVGAVATGTMIYYCCTCCIVPPAIVKKKKKEEEEDSTYTVHGPGGLIDDGSVYSESYYSSDDGSDYSYESSVVSSNPEAAKKPKKDKKDKKSGESAGSKFKVHSYRGYNDKDVKKKEKHGEKDGIAARDKTSVGKVHSYAGYVDEESGLDDDPESGERSSHPSKKSIPLHDDKSLVTTVIRSIASSLAGTPNASSTDPDEEEEEEEVDDSLYRTQMEHAPSDSFFENDGVDDDQAEQEHAVQSSNLRTKRAKKLIRVQVHDNDTQSVGTADSHSLVDQARAHVAAAREVTLLRRSQPLRCISPAMLSDSEDDDEATPRVATFRDDPPTPSSARRDSDAGSVDSASLVEQARAKVAAIRAKQKGDLSANSSFTLSNGGEGIASPTSSFRRAKTSYADYKAKLEQEDSLRTEEAALIRQTLERARLQSEGKIEDKQKRIEREAFEAAVLEESEARAKADQAAKQRIANFKVHQEEMARQRAEEEAKQKAHLEVALVEAEDGIVRQLSNETYEFAESATQPEAVVSSLTSDRLRQREESRLRAEEKARARFAAFKATAQPDSSGTNDNQVHDEAAAAVEAVRHRLSSVNLQLAEKRAVQTPSMPTQVTSSVVTSSTSTKSLTVSVSTKSHLSTLSSATTDSVFEALENPRANMSRDESATLFSYSGDENDN